MMSKLHLILAFHNHQPVGNFDHVLEDCYRKSYLPFLETLMEHPGIRVVLHYSGFLLSWINDNHPEAIEMIRSLVKEDRVEILSGGFYEPILSVLPERDRVAQITMLSKFIKKTVGYEPRGMWLAERVWEPQMPQFISSAGISYLPLDDYHFKLSGLEEGELVGYFNTEDAGSVVSVFPGSEKLRYFIPFRSVEEIISYFRVIHMRGGDPVLTMADDGEKFGSWPNTYQHCYGDGCWLNSFFSELTRNAGWIETTTFRDYHERFKPSGRVYLPTASYREMGEWTLPAEAALEYEYVLDELTKIMGERSKQFLRGGIWRSFMVKYPEANHLHKRMTMISRQVHAAMKKDPAEGRKALDELWKGQCNDAYWHGVFGGLYLPHLRSALYRHLIRAESLAGNILKEYPKSEQSDFDCDGSDDIIVSTKKLTVVATETGGALTELSLKKNPVNILDILSRRPEAYHSKIAKASENGSDLTRTIHEQLVLKEEGLADYLVYDQSRRMSLLDHFLPFDTGILDISRAEHDELGDFLNAPYRMQQERKAKDTVLTFSREGTVNGSPLHLSKTVRITAKDDIRVTYTLDGQFSGLFAVEMNISLLGSPYASIHAGGDTLAIQSTAVHDCVSVLELSESYLKLKTVFTFDEVISVWHYPVETVSLSEQGIERLYQGTAFLFVMRLDLRGPREFGFTISFQED
ncbi:MAG: alpha-amylase/4-alpha-glucanotransferase domain-containing protein [Thermodesulfovibrionales bacterium]